MTKTEETAREFLRGLVAGSIPDQLVTEDFTVWTTLSGEMTGERYRGGIGLLGAVFKEPMRMEIGAVTAADQCVVVETQSRATLRSGDEYANNYVFIFRFEGDRIAAIREHFDPRPVIEKLAPAMREAAAQAGPVGGT